MPPPTTLPHARGGGMGGDDGEDTAEYLLLPRPVRVWEGHESDIVDVCWSSYRDHGFLLSASTDKTARLWHRDQAGCLGVFQHKNVVSCVRFHPANEDVFLTGSLDRKLRLWSKKEAHVVEWAQSRDLVTAACFTPDGSMVLAGDRAGTLTVFHTKSLK